MRYALILCAIVSTGCGGIGGYARAGAIRTANFDTRPEITDQGPPPTHTRSQAGAGFQFRSDLQWLGGITGFRAFGADFFPEIGPVFYLGNHGEVALTALPDISPSIGSTLLQAEASYLFGNNTGWRWGFGANYGVTAFLDDRERRVWVLGASVVMGYHTDPF